MVDQPSYDDVPTSVGWVDTYEVLYERAVNLLQGVARGLMTAEEALRELEERVP